ncbi:Uncharacterised protein [Neisseria meningitidis]|nr:Uncharacterised protein [Neisseria meningitidis]CWO65933.1 Uncharacterised protein [Neisseria meningitidis]CWQ85007.1 Uncharacterised protein [Neisseria meningitidis]
MDIRIELIARFRVDFLDLRSIKCFLQLVQSHLHAHFQRIEIAALIQKRHFQIILDRQHFHGKLLSGELVRIRNFLLVAAAQVLLVCQSAQLLVFQLRFQLGNPRLQILISRLCGSLFLHTVRISYCLDGFHRLHIFNRFFTVLLLCLFAHIVSLKTNWKSKSSYYPRKIRTFSRNFKQKQRISNSFSNPLPKK